MGELSPDRPDDAQYPINEVEIELSDNVLVMVSVYTADPVSGVSSNQQLHAYLPQGAIIRGKMKITV